MSPGEADRARSMKRWALWQAEPMHRSLCPVAFSGVFVGLLLGFDILPFHPFYYSGFSGCSGSGSAAKSHQAGKCSVQWVRRVGALQVCRRGFYPIIFRKVNTLLKV